MNFTLHFMVTYLKFLLRLGSPMEFIPTPCRHKMFYYQQQKRVREMCGLCARRFHEMITLYNN